MSTTYSHKLTNFPYMLSVLFSFFCNLSLHTPIKIHINIATLSVSEGMKGIMQSMHSGGGSGKEMLYIFNSVLGKIFLSQRIGVIAPKKTHRTTYDYANINMYEFLQYNTNAIPPFSEEKECKMNAAFPDFDLQKSFKNLSSECLLRCVPQYTFVANM